MTTRRIMEIEDDGSAMPGFVHSGQGFLVRRRRERVPTLVEEAELKRFQPTLADIMMADRLMGRAI